MAVRCPTCGLEYEVTFFESGKEVACSCGEILRLEDDATLKALRELVDDIEDRDSLERLQREADKICGHILRGDLPAVDIEILESNLRSEFEKNFPDKIRLYEMVYEARFKRLKEQFGEDREP